MPCSPAGMCGRQGRCRKSLPLASFSCSACLRAISAICSLRPAWTAPLGWDGPASMCSSSAESLLVGSGCRAFDAPAPVSLRARLPRPAMVLLVCERLRQGCRSTMIRACICGLAPVHAPMLPAPPTGWLAGAGLERGSCRMRRPMMIVNCLKPPVQPHQASTCAGAYMTSQAAADMHA